MANSSAQTIGVSDVVEVLFAYRKSLGKEVPEKWDPSMNPFKDLGFKSRDGADLAEEFGKLVGHDLPDDCNPLVKRNAEGNKRARTLAEVAEFLNTLVK